MKRGKGTLGGRLHVGVIPELRPLPGLNYLPLYGEASQLYCSHDHPLYSTQTLSVEEIGQQVFRVITGQRP